MRVLALALVLVVAVAAAPAAAAPAGQLTWAVHVSLAPTWFDPAETPGLITPFMALYALHDALVKPMPGNAMAPSLAESWTVSKDGLVYEFIPVMEPAFLNGVGPRVDVHGLNLIQSFAYSAPYEELKLKAK